MDRRIGLAAFWALLALQIVWHLWLAPPRVLPPWLVAGIAIAPLLPVAWAVLKRRPRALFWGALLALFYFCHGISEWWTTPATRVLAAAQTLLCVTLILSVGWKGLRRRR